MSYSPTTPAEYKARLAAMFAEVSGVTKAFAAVPRVIQHTELPAMVPFTRNADYDNRSMGEQTMVVRRILEGALYVAELTQGTESSAEQAAEDMIPVVQAYFWGRPGMTTSADSGIVYDMELIGDGGVVQRAFPVNSSNLYAVVPFYFRVRTWDIITYKE